MYSDFDTTTQEYVEIIYDIQKYKKVARVKDIAEKRGVTRSSVSTALNLLKKKGLITHESYGLIELTEKGNLLGKELEERHEIIKDFFLNILFLDPDIADENACKLEHHISSSALKSLVNFITFLKHHPDLLNNYNPSIDSEYFT